MARNPLHKQRQAAQNVKRGRVGKQIPGMPGKPSGQVPGMPRKPRGRIGVPSSKRAPKKY